MDQDLVSMWSNGDIPRWFTDFDDVNEHEEYCSGRDSCSMNADSRNSHLSNFQRDKHSS